MVPDPGWDVDAYILNSTNRQRVLEYLALSGPATPSQIAADTDSHRSHISRALQELREKDVVELQVDESREMGRYYALTSAGETVWSRIEDRVRHVSWTIEEPTDPRLREILTVAKAEFGDALRAVGRYDDGTLTFLYMDDDVLSEYSEEEIQQSARVFVFEHTIDEVSWPDETLQSEILTFSEFSIVRFLGDEVGHLAISFQHRETVSIPDFVERISAIVDGDAAEKEDG
jgi:DNA-binding MarR family transcriptional regulator